MAGPVFIAGNKRSGTSQLIRMLNLHPHVFISHESDVVWILYQYYQNKPFESYPQDSRRGMDLTLQQCGYVLTKTRSPQENYLALQHCMMTKGNPWLAPMSKKDLQWIGDKKPFQHADPQLIEFILGMFPDARFIHMVRHPFAVAQSSEQFNRTIDGDFWVGLTLEEKVERWMQNEKIILALKQSKKAKVFDIRYEDLCKDPANELISAFTFLDLGIDRHVIKRAQRNTHFIIKNYPAIPCTKETLSIMEIYGYKPEGIERNPFDLGATNTYWKLRRFLGYS